jgi:hypothetical protein
MEDHWLTVERITIAFFAALPPTLMALAALIAAIRAYRAAQTSADRLDGRLDQLVKAERGKARLEGTLEGQAEAIMPKPKFEIWQPREGDKERGPRTDLPPPPDATRGPRGDNPADE